MGALWISDSLGEEVNVRHRELVVREIQRHLGEKKRESGRIIGDRERERM